MAPAEQAERIKEIYDEALAKLDVLSNERTELINNYIKELEEKKVQTLRGSLNLTEAN